MMASIWHENMLGYLPLDIIRSSKLTLFLEFRSQKTVPFLRTDNVHGFVHILAYFHAKWRLLFMYTMP